MRGLNFLIFEIKNHLRNSSLSVSYWSMNHHHHHALQEFARLAKGETVLIHSASGGTGQWAIQIANYIGDEVYATVSSDIKKKWIQDLYEIPKNHIFCSRNTAFAEKIARMTQGRGMDVVLNTLSDEGLVAS